MAYKDGFVIEYVEKQPTRLSCRVCAFIGKDKSCSKRGLYVPDVGYDNWKYCNSFRLASDFEENEELQAKYQAHRNRKKPKGNDKAKVSPTSSASGRQRHTQAERLHRNQVKPNSQVVHKRHGRGRVEAVLKDKVIVCFSGKRARLPYPDCIASGDLQIVAADEGQTPEQQNKSSAEAARASRPGCFEGNWVNAYIYHSKLGLGQIYSQSETYLTAHFPARHRTIDLTWKDFTTQTVISYMGGFLSLSSKEAKRLNNRFRACWDANKYYFDPFGAQENASKARGLKPKPSTKRKPENQAAKRSCPKENPATKKTNAVDRSSAPPQTNRFEEPSVESTRCVMLSQTLIGELVYSYEFGLGRIVSVTGKDAKIAFPLATQRHIKLSAAAERGRVVFYAGPYAFQNEAYCNKLKAQMLTQWLNKNWKMDPIAALETA